MNEVLALNLWSPHHGLSIGIALLTAFALGVVHGVTPDEHTWPITFSYAMGSFSARRGMRSALAFSFSFTVQRALLSELAYLGMLEITDNPTWNAAVYIVVGAVMVLAAFYVLHFRCALHLHLWPPSIGRCHRQIDIAGWAARTPTPAMAAVHGFVAGWGLGAFALIMATALAPAMPNAALGWLPPDGGTHESAPEAIARLARKGYGRRFELARGRLWCPSCEVTFDAHELLVEAAVPVAGEADMQTGTVYALRCTGCGAAGTWLVIQPGPEELRLLDDLRRGDSAMTTDRASSTPGS